MERVGKQKHKLRTGRRVVTVGELAVLLGDERHRVGRVVRERGVDLRDAGAVVRFVVWWVKKMEESSARSP